tara:strand:+ start:1320 stop:1475 length:156 start_codon:yes stop_codon:yes gene_type:complete
MKKEDRLEDHKETFLLMFMGVLRDALKTGDKEAFKKLEEGLEAAKQLIENE